jgi:hypothetical protein
MQNPSFKELLDKLQEQNQRGFLTQLLQLKADREIAGEDGDKREEQLDEVISSLKDVKVAVTGIDINVDITPLVNIGENQTRLLEELSRESALTRKLTEGSVEYDKAAAQYRNTSGREIESAVTGKVSKKGGFLDFETARTATAGQGERARKANEISLKPIDYVPGKSVATVTNNSTTNNKSSNNNITNTNIEAKEEKNFFKTLGDEIVSGVKYFMTDGLSERPSKKERESKVSSPRQKPVSANPDSDNIVTSQETIADTTKADLEITRELLDTTKAQLIELKTIREALAPSTPEELVEQKSAPSATTEPVSSGIPGIDLPRRTPRLPVPTGPNNPKGKVPPGSTGSKVLGGLGKVARVLGPAAVAAGAAYSGFQGYQNTGTNFDIEEGKEASIGQKTASALGGVASGLTFGLVNEKTAAQGVYRAGEAVSGAASKVKNFLGERMAAGDGKRAEKAFRENGTPTIDPLRAGVTKEQAQAALENGSPRDIEKLGGREALIKIAGIAPVAGVSAEQAQAARSNYAAVDPRRADMAGRTVLNTSTENADMSRNAGTGTSGGNTIVSNNVNNTSTTKYVPMKASPRPEYTGSALDRYQSRISVY